jgi:hypothetical protein
VVDVPAKGSLQRNRQKKKPLTSNLSNECNRIAQIVGGGVGLISIRNHPRDKNAKPLTRRQKKMCHDMRSTILFDETTGREKHYMIEIRTAIGVGRSALARSKIRGRV